MKNTQSIFEDYQKKAKNSSKHYIAAAICLVLVLASFVVFINIGNTKTISQKVLPKFSDALNNGDYSEALSIYRDIHDEIVSADPGEEDKYKEQIEIMDQMEAMVSTRLAGIEQKIRYERYTPSNEDLKFMNEMGELTTSLISEWLNSLSEEFLLGTIEKPDIVFIFDQMTTVGNVSASAVPLRKEIETIEVARGDVQNAEAAFNQGDYIKAVHLYQSVINDYEGFVYNFSINRVAEIKSIMYEPMLVLGEHMLETLKYYSAEQLLSDLAVIFPDDNRIKSDLLEATSHTSPTKEYYGNVEVICVKQIIPESLGDNSSYVGDDSNLYLTASQLEVLLNELYNNNYILVDAESLVGLDDSTYLVEQNLIVPEGKKPLIIVVENLDYSVRTYNLNVCRKLVLNEQGQVCGEYVNSDGQTIVSRNAEAIGIIDSFVELHPDFSYNGVKGIVSLCGYESIMGYVVSEDEIDDRVGALSSLGYPSVDITNDDILANQETIKSIATVMSDNGWKFASSTYGCINAKDSDMDTIVSDTNKWIEQVESLVGDTHMIVYPGGNYINGTDPRAVFLKDNGFRIFFGVGSLPYYTYGANYLYYDRSIINMNTLKDSDYSRLFNSQTVIDAR